MRYKAANTEFLNGESLFWGIDSKPFNKSKMKFWNEWNVGAFFIFLAFIISVMVFAFYIGDDLLITESLLYIGLDILVLVLLSLMYISCSRSVRFDKTSACFMFLLGVCALFAYLDALFWIVNGKESFKTVNIIVKTLYYICPAGLIFVYLHFVHSLVNKFDKYFFAIIKKVLYVFGIADAVIVIVNLYGEYFFSVHKNGMFVKNENTYYLMFVFPVLMFLLCAFYIIKLKLSVFDKITLIFCPALPLFCGVITALISESNFVPVISFCSIFIIYINLFIRRERELILNQKMLADSKIKSMVLQINPHFIYNTLGSIGSLCVEEPEKAREMIYTFSDYLRSNLGEMTKKAMIPFEQEIEHLKSYIEIEKCRFPDIEVILDLSVTDFSIPSLSVQPLVENAITHGIMGRESGGTVKISSFEDEKFYYICIEDNGVGFDKFPQNDGKNHIGINNVSNRLKMLCDGELLIESTVEKGTQATIKISKKGEKP